jgi:hypothetical protein
MHKYVNKKKLYTHNIRAYNYTTKNRNKKLKE